MSSNRKAYLLRRGYTRGSGNNWGEQAGLYEDGRLEVRYLLNVPSRKASYQAEHKEMVSLIDLSSIPRVGQRVPVVVDPRNQKNLLLGYR
ncbi:MAG TPA: hypothetical protein VK436_01855 [Methanocella sp.]|nr:hypothetical protein [Methanocella sp.]